MGTAETAYKKCIEDELKRQLERIKQELPLLFHEQIQPGIRNAVLKALGQGLETVENMDVSQFERWGGTDHPDPTLASSALDYPREY